MSFYDAEGRRVFVRGFGNTPAEAVRHRHANYQRRSQEGGVVRQRRSVGVTLEDHMQKWLASYPPEKMTETSKLRHRRVLETWILPHLTMPLDRISTADIESMLDKIRDADGKVLPSARVNAFKTLRALVNHAVRNGVIPQSPLATVTPPTAVPQVRANDDAWVSRRVGYAEGMVHWLENPANPRHDFYTRMLLMLIGLRRAELLGLEWKCFTGLDRKGAGKVVIRQQLMRDEATKNWSIYPATKTRKPRTIFLPDFMRVAFNELKQRQAALPVPEGGEWARDLVFRKPNGKWITYNEHAADWRDALTAYVRKDWDETYRKKREASDSKRTKKGLPLLTDEELGMDREAPELHDEKEYFRPHAMRRVAVSILAGKGVPIEAAQDLLGHSHAEMTRYYLSVSNDSRRQASAAFETIGGASRRSKPSAKKGT